MLMSVKLVMLLSAACEVGGCQLSTAAGTYR